MANNGEEPAEERGEEKSAPPFPLHGDLLQEVLRHLPAVDLVAARYVSTAWRQAVHTSFLPAPRSKPWIFLHAQRRHRPSVVATHAYDPHSRLWLRVPRAGVPPPHLSSALRANPGCGLLYVVTGSRLALSAGGLGAPWRDLGALRDWRMDPVVAAVGNHVLVAGGTSGLPGENPCAVEVYRADGVATACEPIPEAFRGSASATFLSVAASHKKAYVMERSTGLICSFDVDTGAWGATAMLRPDPSLFSSSIAFSGSRLVLAGLGLDGKDALTLKLWAADCDTFECDEVGAMPGEMLGCLAGGDDPSSSSLTSVDLSVVGDFAYVCKPSDPALVVTCDFAGGECRWTKVRAPAGVGENPAETYVFSCSEVGMADLQAAFWPGWGRGTTAQ